MEVVVIAGRKMLVVVFEVKGETVEEIRSLKVNARAEHESVTENERIQTLLPLPEIRG